MAKPLQGLILYHPYVGSYHLTYSIQMWRDNLGLGRNEIDPIRFFCLPQCPICKKKHWGVANRREGRGAAGTNM